MFLAQMSAPELPQLPDGPALEHLRGPIVIPTYAPWQIALMIAAGLLLLGLLLWLILRARKKLDRPTPPYEIAIRELEVAATTSDDERFATLSSQALRRYLEDGMGLQFSARTSEEFLRSLKGNTRFDDDFQKTLSQVLTVFDRIKFAQESIPEQERIQITDMVRSLIEQTHASTLTEGAAK
jgi:hypothetical protein